MAKVQGMKEKLHHPIYDAFRVPTDKTVKEAMTDGRVIRFFVDVQQKTRLDTNLQTAGMLPSLNSFEARALRIVATLDNPVRDPRTQVDPQATFLRSLIYRSVTSLLVGEKLMIEMPTFWFPSGSGIENDGANHGRPDPMATFRFAEPVHIEPQQNFRVEMAFPEPAESFEKQSGPLRIWAILDGYLTRDVQ